RRLDFFFDGVLDEAIIDGDDGDALLQKWLRIRLLVAVLPASAVDIKDNRRRLIRGCLVEIKDLAWMTAIFDADELFGLIGPAMQHSNQHNNQRNDSLHGDAPREGRLAAIVSRRGLLLRVEIRQR